ncbi:MAG: type II secretion system F family protein [Armatimonadota bacterium]
MTTTPTICPHCGTDNRTGRRICYHCRRELPVQAGEPALVKKPARTLSTHWSARYFHALPLMGASVPQRINYYQQLYGHLHTGIPLGLALTYQENNTFFHLRPVIHDLAMQVKEGAQLSVAMAQYPGLFPAWESGLIAAGEQSGRLTEAVQNILETLEMEQRMRSRLLTSTYQLQATLVALIICILIINDIGGGTPIDYRSILSIGVGLLLQVVGIIAVCFVLVQLYRLILRTRAGAELAYVIASRLPLVGPILRDMARLRFVRVMASLWDAGVFPIGVLEYAASASGSQFIQNQVAEQIGKMKEGCTVYDAVSALGIFPKETLYMLRAGESSGRVAESMRNVAEYFRIDLEQAIHLLPNKAIVIFYVVIVILVVIMIVKLLSGAVGGMG